MLKSTKSAMNLAFDMLDTEAVAVVYSTGVTDTNYLLPVRGLLPVPYMPCLRIAPVRGLSPVPFNQDEP